MTSEEPSASAFRAFHDGNSYTKLETNSRVVGIREIHEDTSYTTLKMGSSTSCDKSAPFTNQHGVKCLKIYIANSSKLK
jgi:hypothetical protein